MRKKKFSRISDELYAILNTVERETTDEIRIKYRTDVVSESFDVFNSGLYLLIAAEGLLRQNRELKIKVNQLEEENKHLKIKQLMVKEEPRKDKQHVELDGEKIALLKQSGYSMKKMAQMFGVSRSTIWRKISAYEESL